LPTNHCWCQSSRVIALSCGIKISAVHHLVLSQSTRACDREPDGQTDRITTPKTALAYARAKRCLQKFCFEIDVLATTRGNCASDNDADVACRFRFVVRLAADCCLSQRRRSVRLYQLLLLLLLLMRRCSISRSATRAVPERPR